MTIGSIALIAIALAVGALVPIQAGVNATLASHGGHSLYAAVTNTAVATLALLLMIVALRIPFPASKALTAAPWFAWTGGLCGAALVLSAIVIAPKLGAASYVSAMILGTVACSLIVDHLGLLIFEARPISLARLAGGALVVIGMVLVNRS